MRVRIYRPARTVMQSGRARRSVWLLEGLAEAPRETEPVMGWLSSRETAHQVRLRFSSAHEAVRFAQKRGWAYDLDKTPNERHNVPRSYVDRFLSRGTV